MIMKIFLIFMFFLLHISFASEYCIFDAKGNCVTTIQSQEAYINFQKTNNQTKYYIAFSKSQEQREKQTYSKFSYRKAKGKKRWYEVDWNQGVKLCPEQNFNSGNGVWVVNGSAHIDSLNCVYVDGSPYTRSILVLFARDLNDLTEADSNWILVNQTIVELAGKSYDISINYRNRKKISFRHDLIVDKTELRIKDAIWLREDISALKKKDMILLETKPLMNHYESKFYPHDDSLKILDYPVPMNGELISLRSIKDGLNRTTNLFSFSNKIDLSNVFYKSLPFNDMMSVLDTSENGYRFPLNDEWIILQSGSQRKFIWGENSSEYELRKYMKIECATDDVGVYPVKQYEPNPLGLYDVYGNAEEYTLSIYDRKYSSGPVCDSYVDSHHLSDVCLFLKSYVCSEFGKAHNKNTTAAFKNGLIGMRLVRKLD